MSTRPRAPICWGAAIVLAASAPAWAADQQHPQREGSGKAVAASPAPSPPVLAGPLMRVGPRDSYDYYGERRASPGARKHLSQKEITLSLRKRGFHDIGAPRRRGSIYIFEATGPEGERVRLIVNALTGGIDGVRAIGSSRRFRLP